mgnify:CR=1 FL=1
MNKNPKAVFTAINKYVNINELHEIIGLNGGEETETRWDVKSTTVEKVREQLIDSITTTGFLTGIIGVKTSEDTTLYGKTYPKDHYMILDESGRTRVLQHLVKNGYVINPGSSEHEDKVPVLDVTHLVVTNGTKKITEDIVQNIWQKIGKLNTGSLNWSDFDFLSSGSRAITDPVQKEIWKYLVNTMRKHNPTLSNKVILGGTINKLTEKMINEAHINFDLDTYARYSNHIFDGLLQIRKQWTTPKTKAPFLRALAVYALSSAKNNGFSAGLIDREPGPEKNPNPNFGKLITDPNERGCVKTYFTIDEKSPIGSDKHFSEFKYYFDIIVRGLCMHQFSPPAAGYAGTESAATLEFKDRIFKIYENREEWNK